MPSTSRFVESEKNAYWYVEVPPDRPLKRAISKERWIALVNRLIRRDSKGNRVIETVDGTFSVDGSDSSEWKRILRGVILNNGYRMCWEPKTPRNSRRFATDADGRQFVCTVFGDVYVGTPEYEELRQWQKRH